MIYLVLILSFWLDYIFLNVVSNNSIIFPLFTLMSVIIIYSFFKRHKYNKYLTICAGLGILYDVVYADALFLNLGLFLFLGILVKLFFKSFSYNLINSIVIGFLVICFYRLLSYIVLVTSGYLYWSFGLLLKGIYSSLIINLIYIICLYSVLSYINKKHTIQRFRRF